MRDPALNLSLYSVCIHVRGPGPVWSVFPYHTYMGAHIWSKGIEEIPED